jgi:hypothetical protein
MSTFIGEILHRNSKTKESRPSARRTNHRNVIVFGYGGTKYFVDRFGKVYHIKSVGISAKNTHGVLIAETAEISSHTDPAGEAGHLLKNIRIVHDGNFRPFGKPNSEEVGIDADE